MSESKLPFTHEATLVFRSNNDDTGVQVEMNWSPLLTGEDYKALGYQPASHTFIERWVLPMLEEAFMHTNHPELMEDPPTGSVN